MSIGIIMQCNYPKNVGCNSRGDQVYLKGRKLFLNLTHQSFVVSLMLFDIVENVTISINYAMAEMDIGCKVDSNGREVL